MQSETDAASTASGNHIIENMDSNTTMDTTINNMDINSIDINADQDTEAAAAASSCNSCTECGAVFEKRNALFRHLEVMPPSVMRVFLS